MAKSRLSPVKVACVTKGYGQVEPNHLSAQYNGKIHAQWPADPSIDLLENGQFVKYDPETGFVGFSGKGEWMLVFNEVKVYWDGQGDQDFAMKKSDYAARVYSPVGHFSGTPAQGLNYNGVIHAPEFTPDGVDNISGPAQFVKPLMMPTKTISENGQDVVYSSNMVPRLFVTDVGDIMTTNTIKANASDLHLGDDLTIDATDGYLKVKGNEQAEQIWTVSKIYTMPDGQPGVKVIRTK